MNGKPDNGNNEFYDCNACFVCETYIVWVIVIMDLSARSNKNNREIWVEVI